MRDDLRGSLRVLTVSLATPRSLAIAGVAGLAVFAFAVWAPNLGLIWSVATAPDLALVRRAGVLWATLASAGLTLSPGAAVVPVGLAILVGLNIALAVALGGAAGRGIGFGGAGALVGAIGAGCSACGVGILATVLGPAASAAWWWPAGPRGPGR